MLEISISVASQDKTADKQKCQRQARGNTTESTSSTIFVHNDQNYEAYER